MHDSLSTAFLEDILTFSVFLCWNVDQHLGTLLYLTGSSVAAVQGAEAEQLRGWGARLQPP